MTSAWLHVRDWYIESILTRFLYSNRFVLDMQAYEVESNNCTFLLAVINNHVFIVCVIQQRTLNTKQCMLSKVKGLLLQECFIKNGDGRGI